MRSASRKVRRESDADPMMSSDEDDRPHVSRKGGPLYNFSQQVNISLCLSLHIHSEHLAENAYTCFYAIGKASDAAVNH